MGGEVKVAIAEGAGGHVFVTPFGMLPAIA